MTELLWSQLLTCTKIYMACGKFNMKAKLKKNAWQTVLIFQNSYNDKNYILIIWKKKTMKKLWQLNMFGIYLYISNS